MSKELIIFHGSPCQDFSIAGKQAGGDIDSGTRSSLLYETVRIVKKLKPKYVIWENVKNVISKKHRHNFDNYLKEMEELGYTNYYQVLNAKDYGIPQNRERVFTVSILDNHTEKDENNSLIVKDFKFPPKQDLKLRLKDMLTNDYDELIKSKPNKTPSRDKMKIKCKNITNLEFCKTITLKQDRYPNAGIIDFEDYYRFLTPREQWLLMGFDNNDFEKAKSVNSSKLLLEKQAGNSIVVNVLEAIFDSLLDKDKEYELIELFGGIGAPRKALQRKGFNFKTIDYVEIDKYAVKSYNVIFDEDYETKDINEYLKD